MFLFYIYRVFIEFFLVIYVYINDIGVGEKYKLFIRICENVKLIILYNICDV